MDVREEVKVPTGQLADLLNEHGSETTWRALIRQLALHSYPHGDASGVLRATEFGDDLPQVPNLLDRLTIGQIAIMYEFSLAYTDVSSRKAAGQYFTPDDLAQFLAARCAQLGKGVWLDPASGVGNLSYWLAAIQPDPEAFVSEFLLLSDRDPQALLIARALFSLLFYSKRENLFAQLAPRFVLLDFLEGEIPEHDFVLMNPPYAVREPDERFELAATREAYAYFIERTVKTSRGFVSVTPQSFLNGNKFASLRALLLKNFNFLRIWSFDNMPDSAFSGVKFGSTNTNTANSTRAAVTVAMRQEAVDHKLTSLLRWPSAHRAQLLTRADEFLTSAELNDYKFPKVLKPTGDLLREVGSFPPLSSLLDPKGQFSISVPASPRYYISAVKRSLNRSSLHTLRFNSEKERDKAYLLLNSGLTYWWWRLMDGGMQLSLEVLLSTPVPDFEVDYSLVTELEVSEVQNLAVKANAGKANENVKHPTWLRNRLDTKLYGHARAAQFQSIATNDDLSYLP